MAEDLKCRKCDKTAPPCSGVAYGGPLGEAIKTSICHDCWTEWMGQSVKIINELKLNLKDAYSREMLTNSMKDFLNIKGV